MISAITKEYESLCKLIQQLFKSRKNRIVHTDDKTKVVRMCPRVADVGLKFIHKMCVVYNISRYHPTKSVYCWHKNEIM